ncbi:MAG: hypothetical protein IKZ49_00535 [Alphaproteobacteria bacterium]|nr:hypothetical protein [Alphaproteobacteria bacterium]
MAENSEQIVNQDKTQVSALEQTYMKYFGSLDKIDSIYHKIKGPKEPVLKVVSKKDTDRDSEIENAIRCALLLNNDGFKNKEKQDLSYEQLLAIRSVLANLPKLQNVSLKKVVLYYFRRYESHTRASDNTDAVRKHSDELERIVAASAIANGLGITHDYCNLHEYDTLEKINTLIAQAKLDIKAEMETDVPSFYEIETICKSLLFAEEKSGILPSKTRQMLEKEFDPNKIIAGGDYVSKFEKNIEIKHAEIETLKQKAIWYDKMKEEIEAAKKEAEYWRKQMEAVTASANAMRASVFSIGVNRHKMLVAAIGKDAREK